MLRVRSRLSPLQPEVVGRSVPGPQPVETRSPTPSGLSRWTSTVRNVGGTGRLADSVRTRTGENGVNKKVFGRSPYDDEGRSIRVSA